MSSITWSWIFCILSFCHTAPYHGWRFRHSTMMNRGVQAYRSRYSGYCTVTQSPSPVPERDDTDIFQHEISPRFVVFRKSDRGKHFLWSCAPPSAHNSHGADSKIWNNVIRTNPGIEIRRRSFGYYLLRSSGLYRNRERSCSGSSCVWRIYVMQSDFSKYEAFHVNMTSFFWNASRINTYTPRWASSSGGNPRFDGSNLHFCRYTQSGVNSQKKQIMLATLVGRIG